VRRDFRKLISSSCIDFINRTRRTDTDHDL